MPDARLLLKSLFIADAQAWDDVIAHLVEQGIAAQRIGVLPRTAWRIEHLHCYNQVDIALDTYPYHGTTTTCEALFMGVPVMTLAGDRHAARVSASILSQVGLQEFIACRPEAYAPIALQWARQPERLAALRHDMRARLQASPLRDELGFTGAFADALRQMWSLSLQN
jgi:predicted O-linked N-acetylglucosamine transferase (SPINDLY family)